MKYALTTLLTLFTITSYGQMNNVNNNYPKKMAEKSLKKSLGYLGIKGTVVSIIPITNDIMRNISDGELLEGVVINDGDGRFILYLKKGLSKRGVIKTIAHEAIHIKQFHNKKLVQKDDHTFIYNGKEYDTKKVDYYERKWEREALKKESTLFRNISQYFQQ